ncbi:MAG: FkbM family methyltransferase [Terriglobales bacterium]
MDVPIIPGPLPPNPLVSILTANYNYARFLADAVDSARAQTYANWEMILCDDASTDDSREVIRSLCATESRIQPIFNESNSGHGASLNACFAASRGELICLLDADDIWRPEKLEQVLAAAARSPSAGLLMHPLLKVGPGGRRLGIIPERPLRAGWFGPEMAATGGTPPVTLSSGLSLRRRVAAEIFPLPAGFRTTADMAVCVQALAITATEPVSQSPLCLMRFHGGNVTSTGARRSGAAVYEGVTRTHRLAFELAAKKSGLPGPWPAPWGVVLSDSLSRRLRGEIPWKDYYRLLRASPSRPAGTGRLWRLFFEWAPIVPPRAFPLVYRSAFAIRTQAFRLADTARREVPIATRPPKSPHFEPEPARAREPRLMNSTSRWAPRPSQALLPALQKIRIGLWASRNVENFPALLWSRIQMRPQGRLQLRSGPTFILNTTRSEISAVYEVFGCHVYAPLHPIPTTGTVVDIGSNIGAFAVYAAKHLVPNGRVLAIEPNPNCVRTLRRNLAENGVGHVEVREGAVGAGCGTAELNLHRGASTYSSIYGGGLGEGKLPVRIVNPKEILNWAPEIDLMKADCEGGEHALLWETTAKDWRGVKSLVLEYHLGFGTGYRSDTDLGLLEARLRELGFSVCSDTPKPGPFMGQIGIVRATRS